MMRRRPFNGKKGQSLVETALVLPIIILILMGIIDFGLMFNNYLVVNNASREGARNAAIGTPDSEIEVIVENLATTLDPAKLTISITPAQALRNKGDEVTVTVEYDYALITPVVGAIVPGPLQLRGTTIMRVE